MMADGGCPAEVVPGAAGEKGEVQISMSGRQGRSQRL
jgi:hypothetical protein